MRSQTEMGVDEVNPVEPSRECGTETQTSIATMTETATDTSVGEWEQRAAERASRSEEVRRRARAVYAAVAGWGEVQTQEDWDRIVDEALDQYESGRFLIEQMGAEHPYRGVLRVQLR